MTNYLNTHKSESFFTIAFYNLENLFDIYDDEQTDDNDFLPTSDKKWTIKRYHNKLRKLGYTISNIGKDETNKQPTLIGLAEVENANVLKDLLNSKHLENLPYGYVHYDSPDERGIDVALLYDTSVFKVTDSNTFSVELTDENGARDYTRDILLVNGMLDNELIHILVNHWPSRHEGSEETEYKRLAAANKLNDIIHHIKQENVDAKIVIVGDFNDDPTNKSIKQVVGNNNLYNPMELLLDYDRGSLNHNFSWDLFDQILITSNFLNTAYGDLQFVSANIFDVGFLRLFKGKHKGEPFRTYVGKKYKGGYSDHFPVYALLKKGS